MATQPTMLDGQPVLANVIRLFIIFTGFTLALVALKISFRAWRFLDWERAFGTLAFACVVITPAINGLYRFDAPLQAVSTSVYLTGLLAGVIATWFRQLRDRRRARRIAQDRDPR